MYKLVTGLLAAAFFALPAQSQTLIYEADFAAGKEDWQNEARTGVNRLTSGGQDGGAFIRTFADIDTSGGGGNGFGGYTVFRCAVAPSQLPSQNCSSGNFVGDWYLTDGVQELSFWFRHNSGKAGGLEPIVRVATPNNALGGSGIFAAVPANTWTKLTITIDTQDPQWDDNWGSPWPDAVSILDNVGRIQVGYRIDPNDPVYTESNVRFDLDDVSISGGTVLAVEVNQTGTLHPHHNGGPNAIAGLNDNFNMTIYGASTGSGDPVTINTNQIVNSSLRIGQLGGVPISVTKGLDLAPSDGLNDARATTKTGVGGAGMLGEKNFGCNQFYNPDEIAVRGELSSGEIIAGLDSSLAADCNAQCHN